MPAPAFDATGPRWDGQRILFSITDQGRTVPCAISVNALQDLSDVRRFSPDDLLACFAAARARIAAIAHAKLHARSSDSDGLVFIWSDDIDEADPAPDDAPDGKSPDTHTT